MLSKGLLSSLGELRRAVPTLEYRGSRSHPESTVYIDIISWHFFVLRSRFNIYIFVVLVFVYSLGLVQQDPSSRQSRLTAVQLAQSRQS